MQPRCPQICTPRQLECRQQQTQSNACHCVFQLLWHSFNAMQFNAWFMQMKQTRAGIVNLLQYEKHNENMGNEDHAKSGHLLITQQNTQSLCTLTDCSLQCCHHIYFRPGSACHERLFCWAWGSAQGHMWVCDKSVWTLNKWTVQSWSARTVASAAASSSARSFGIQW